jgi:hypothetical protein
MSLVDCFWIHLNHNKSKYDKMDIMQFADELSLHLQLQQPKKATVLRTDLIMLKGQDMRLGHISNKLGEICQPPTNWQIRYGRETGNSITDNCYICRIYEEGRRNKLCSDSLPLLRLQNASV